MFSQLIWKQCTGQNFRTRVVCQYFFHKKGSKKLKKACFGGCKCQKKILDNVRRVRRGAEKKFSEIFSTPSAICEKKFQHISSHRRGVFRMVSTKVLQKVRFGLSKYQKKRFYASFSVFLCGIVNISQPFGYFSSNSGQKNLASFLVKSKACTKRWVHNGRFEQKLQKKFFRNIS